MKFYSAPTFLGFFYLVSFTSTASCSRLDQSPLPTSNNPIFFTSVGYVTIFSETSSTLAETFKNGQPRFAPVEYQQITSASISKSSSTTSTSKTSSTSSSTSTSKTSSTSSSNTSSTSTPKTSSTITSTSTSRASSTSTSVKTSSTSILKTSSTSILKKSSSLSSSEISKTAASIFAPVVQNASYATVNVVNCSPSAPGRIVNLVTSPQTELNGNIFSLAKPIENPFDINGRKLSTFSLPPGYASWSWYVAGINGSLNSAFSQQDSFNNYAWDSTTVSLCQSLMYYGGCPLSANLFQLVPWSVYLYLPAIVQVFNAHAGDVIVINTSAKTQTGTSLFCVQGTVTLH